MEKEGRIIFSCVIPTSAKDYKSKNLKDLIASIRAQDFPQDQIEILVITEGDSEQAKAIGIRQAKGEICAMFCADNYITNNWLFRMVRYLLSYGDHSPVAIYTKHYHYKKDDNSLNRYFSLMGNNDPIAYYLKKSDRRPFFEQDENEEDVIFNYRNLRIPSYGDNGFFVKTEWLKRTRLENYYPMDNCVDLVKLGASRFQRVNCDWIWHRTSDNLFTFLRKRYHYARDFYCDRNDRRWKMLATSNDYWRLFLFIIFTITLIQPILISLKGFSRIRDFAWFWHWPVCFGFLITYTILAIRNLFKYGRLFQCKSVLSSLHMVDQRLLSGASQA